MSRYHAPLRWGLGHGGLGPAGGGRSSAIWQRTIIMMTVLAAAAGSVLPGSVAGGGARRRAAPVRWAMNALGQRGPMPVRPHGREQRS